MNHTKDARRIGLVDVDGHNGFPNLALMRISAWHKALGDMVEWWDGMLPYDRIYMSKVFTFSPDNDTVMQSDEIIRGGTGYRDYGSLPEAPKGLCQLWNRIDHINPALFIGPVVFSGKCCPVEQKCVQQLRCMA